jgi:hypothetical protein
MRRVIFPTPIRGAAKFSVPVSAPKKRRGAARLSEFFLAETRSGFGYLIST